MENMEISEYSLEKFVLGELNEDRMREIKDCLEPDPRLKERVDGIIKSNAEILAHYPPELVASRILAKMASGKKQRKRFFAVPLSMKEFLVASTALASALVVLLVVFPQWTKHGGDRVPLTDQGDHTHVKGSPPVNLSSTQLLVHRKRNSQVELLQNGVRGQAGDLLQLAYFAAAEPYGTILSIDGRGHVTLHFPETQDMPTTLELRQRVLLAHAIELDNAPGFERFFFITSRQPFQAADVLKAAEILARDKERARNEKLRLPETYSQYSLIIIKGGI
jgi:hypothetical protein